MITFNIESTFNDDEPNTTCFTLDSNRTGKDTRFCRVSYFGNNAFGLVFILLLYFDIWMETKHFKVRVILMSIGSVISSACITVNLFVNNKYYINEKTGIPFTITGLVVCIFGYSLVIMAVGVLLPILLIFKLKWKCRRIMGKLCSGLLLFGLFCVQVRTYTEHWLFTLVGLILIVDIQVVSEE